MGGQYSFTERDGWRISVHKAMAQGKSPYQAFAYMQLCNGSPHSQCWMQDNFSLSFSFKTEGLSQIGTYVKLLFWTDAGNIFGLLPPAHPKSGGKFRLIVFPSDNYPTLWKHEAEIEDHKWFHLQIDFSPSTQAVAAYLDGAKLGNASIPVNMLEANHGPQIGVYSYDSSNNFWPNSFALLLHDMCIGETYGKCPSVDDSKKGRPATTPMLVAMPRPTPLPSTTARPETTPVTGCSRLCSFTNLTAANETCSSQQDQVSCEVGYVTSGLLSVLCAWSTDHVCLADNAKIMYCHSLWGLCGLVSEASELAEEAKELPLTKQITATASIAIAAAASTGVAANLLSSVIG